MDGWISVGERLPKQGGDYIVYAQDDDNLVGVWGENVVTCAMYDCGEWIWRENDNDYDITVIVTYWMPLPEPPRMEGE